MKYIDAERLKTYVQARRDMHYNHYVKTGVGCIAEYKYDEDVELLDLINSLQQEQLLGIEEYGVPGKDFIPVEWVDACEKYGKWKIVQQEQPDFPTTDEQVKEFLATHPKVEVPEKYKTPNWLFDKQPSEDLEEAAARYERENRQSILSSVDIVNAFIEGAKWMEGRR